MIMVLDQTGGVWADGVGQVDVGVQYSFAMRGMGRLLELVVLPRVMELFSYIRVMMQKVMVVSTITELVFGR